MENANRIAIKTLIDEYRSHYNVPVEEWRAFGKMMADYTDSPTFYLEAAGEALEDWNSHHAAALVRRMADGSVDVSAALAANELMEAATDALDTLQAHMTDEDQEEGGVAHDTIQKLQRVIAIARGENKDWKFWSSDAEERKNS